MSSATYPLALSPILGGAEDSPSAPLACNDDVVIQGVARLIEQYVGKPRLEELLRIYLEQVQEAEDAAWQLATERFVSVAVGVQLDGLGEIVGQPRLGLSDDDYRAAIRARIRANNSEGTAPDLYSVAIALLGNPGGTGNVEVEPDSPAAVIVRFFVVLGFDPKIANDLLLDAVAAGVRMIVIALVDAYATTKRFISSSDPAVGTQETAFGFDDANNPGYSSGTFANAMDSTTPAP